MASDWLFDMSVECCRLRLSIAISVAGFSPFTCHLLRSDANLQQGLYATIQAALPYFGQNNWKGRIIVVSPPIYSRFFRGKTAYAIGKVGMSILTKGLAMDWVREGKTDMAITSIWPAAAVESAATQNPQTDRSDLRKAVSELET